MADAVDELERGRESYARRAWLDAYKSLSQADQAAPLDADDLELLATSAYILGRDDEHVGGLERAHHAYLEAGEALHAVRCAFWVGINLALRGELGYLLVPLMVQQLATGGQEAAYALAADAARIGERFGDADLLALAVYHQGHALVKLGRVEEGLGLLDEAMVAVTAGELSPIVTGLIYCSVIEGCQEVYALRRAREWTAALTRWCEQQPDMVAFTGRCLVHRGEIMQLNGGLP